MTAGIRFSNELYVEFNYDTATHKITATAIEGSTVYTGNRVLTAGA